MSMPENLADALQLMLVTDDRLATGADLVSRILDAVSGGATSVQLRLKRVPARELLAVADALLPRLEVPLLVNDRPDVAAAAGAAGVHLGPDDVPVAVARAVLGPGRIVGASVGTPGEAERATGRGNEVDYWGVGPWRVTRTKRDAGPALGEAGTAALLQRACGIPAVVIGGVRPEDAGAIRRLGAAGMAVSSGILGATDAATVAAAYRAAWATASAPG